VHVKHGTNRAGKVIHYYMNYSGDAQVFKYPYKPGEDMLTRTAVTPTHSITLKAWIS
jgi:beta-galactosidase